MLPVAAHIHALVAEASGSFSLTHVLFAAQIRPVKPANKIMVDTAARGQVFYFHIKEWMPLVAMESQKQCSF